VTAAVAGISSAAVTWIWTALHTGPGGLVHSSFGTIQASLTEFAAGERFDLGRVVELEFAFIEVGLDQPEFPTTDADTQAAVSGAPDEIAASVAADHGRAIADPVRGGADAVNAAVRTVDGFTRAVVGVVNDSARVSGAVNGIGAVVSGGYYGRDVSGRGPSTPLVAINQAASLVNRTDAAVLAPTTPNAFFTIDFPSLKPQPSEPWVISEATFSRSLDTGATAELTLMPKEAFTPEPSIPQLYDWQTAKDLQAGGAAQGFAGEAGGRRSGGGPGEGQALPPDLERPRLRPGPAHRRLRPARGP
jgi:hypothetical protein